MKHDAWLNEQLQDPGFAAAYLTAAAQDAEPAVYLAALRAVARSADQGEALSPTNGTR